VGSQLQAFKSLAPNQDVIYFMGHGEYDSWTPALFTSDFKISLGSTKPFVLAAACHTGDYEGGDDTSIAEAFFDSGASLYIGSTGGVVLRPERTGVQEFL